MRCVRGDPIAAGSLTTIETEQETVLRDEATGLIWMSCPADYELEEAPPPPIGFESWSDMRCEYVGGPKGVVGYYRGHVYDYWEALEFCSSTDYGGYEDWRLPTVYEVLSLPVQTDLSSPLTFHLYTSGGPVWTGEPIDEQIGLGYIASADFSSSVGNAVLDDDRFEILCVR